jgi:hypothetical protein
MNRLLEALPVPLLKWGLLQRGQASRRVVVLPRLGAWSTLRSALLLATVRSTWRLSLTEAAKSRLCLGLRPAVKRSSSRSALTEAAKSRLRLALCWPRLWRPRELPLAHTQAVAVSRLHSRLRAVAWNM